MIAAGRRARRRDRGGLSDPRETDLARKAARLSRLGRQFAEAASGHRRARRLLLALQRQHPPRRLRDRRPRDRRVRSARAKVARFVNAAHSAEIIWTRNTTEAINLVSFSWGLQNLKPGDAILTTQVEHHSNIVPWQLLAAKTGAELRYIKADDDGTLQLDDLDALLRGTKLVALSHVSNVARIDRSARADHSARSRCRCTRLGRCGAIGAAHAGRRAGARRRFSRGQRAQDVRADRHRIPLRQTRAARSDAAVPDRRRHDPHRCVRHDDVCRTAVEV